MRTTALALALWACGGDKETTPTDGDAGTCDEIVTAPLTEVPATEWDPALGPALEDYDGLSGRWNVKNECGGATVGIKLVAKDRETLELVTEPWTSTTITCGCANDPLYGDDTDFAPLAFFEGFEFYVETFDDPGVQGQTVIGSGGVFSGGPFSVRSCAVQNIDPILGSAWDQMTAIVRVEGGTIVGTLVLATDEGTVETCSLTDWDLVEAL